jgi:hypothetical protein
VHKTFSAIKDVKNCTVTSGGRARQQTRAMIGAHLATKSITPYRTICQSTCPPDTDYIQIRTDYKFSVSNVFPYRLEPRIWTSFKLVDPVVSFQRPDESILANPNSDYLYQRTKYPQFRRDDFLQSASRLWVPLCNVYFHRSKIRDAHERTVKPFSL